MELLVEFDVLINRATYGFFKVIVENFLAEFDGKGEHELIKTGRWACRVHDNAFGCGEHDVDENDLLTFQNCPALFQIG